MLLLGAEEEKLPGKLPRTYTLTHSDVTSTITLAISRTVNRAQVRTYDLDRLIELPERRRVMCDLVLVQLQGWYIQQAAEGQGGGGVGGGRCTCIATLAAATPCWS